MTSAWKKLLLSAVASIPLWFTLVFLLYGPNPDDVQQQDLHVRNDPNSSGTDDICSYQSWKTVDLIGQDVPKEVEEQAKLISVNDKIIQVLGADVFYREAIPDGSPNTKITILLLHGMAFSSETWLKLGTLQILAAMGYKTVAVDLPGYGKSKSATIRDRADFLEALCESLDLNRPVVVSPSMSGYYSLPFLLKRHDRMGGYVPVAPVGIDVLEGYNCPPGTEKCDQNKDLVPDVLKRFLQDPIPNLNCIKTPSLVVYGEHDRSRNSALLSLLPLSQTVEIPNGKHPAYLDDPPLWHKLLFNFLKHVVQYHSSKE